MEGRPATARLLKLLTSDNKRLDVEERVITPYSKFLSNMVEDLIKPEEQLLPVPNVSMETLTKVLRFCDYRYKADMRRFDGEDPVVLDREMKGWEEQFTRNEHHNLTELMKAADFLHIAPLFDLICGTLAKIIADKSVEQVREIFNIENDFSPEEEAAIRNENPWSLD